MDNIIKQIEVDVYSPTFYEVIKAQQGDKNSRFVEFILFNQGEPYIIPDPDNVIVKLEGSRPNKSPVIKPCTIKDNSITIELDEDLLYYHGVSHLKLVIYKADKISVLSTIPFTLSVQKNPLDSDKFEKDNYSLLNQLILETETVNKNLDIEIERAQNAEKMLTDNLDAEIERAKDAEKNNTDAISAESVRAITKENEIASNLSAEITRATTTENNLATTKANIASPTFTGTPIAPTAATGTNTTQIATTAFVQTAISEGIAASDAMIVKGTIGTNGTITELPITYKTGWTYRVVTEGTYAGQVCEIGDLIIALIDRNGSGNVNSDWCVAQTNINGAITGIKSGDAYITVSQLGSVVTITHKDIARINTTSTISPDSGGTFTAIKSITSDSKGHITNVDTETITLPNVSNTSISASATMPKAAGTAAVGTESAYARGDHIHPSQTSVSGSSGSCTGNSATATKLATARTIRTNLASTSTASFDGSANITPGVTGTLSVANGGTGQTTSVNAANALINSLSTGTSTPADADYYISQSAGGGTTTTTFHRRPMSALWTYIKSKLSAVAISGSYADLTNKPSVPENNLVMIKVKHGVANTSMNGSFTLSRANFGINKTWTPNCIFITTHNTNAVAYYDYDASKQSLSEGYDYLWFRTNFSSPVRYTILVMIPNDQSYV